MGKLSALSRPRSRAERSFDHDSTNRPLSAVNISEAEAPGVTSSQLLRYFPTLRFPNALSHDL
jgi:hypothetical protein